MPAERLKKIVKEGQHDSLGQSLSKSKDQTTLIPQDLSDHFYIDIANRESWDGCDEALDLLLVKSTKKEWHASQQLFRYGMLNNLTEITGKTYVKKKKAKKKSSKSSQKGGIEDEDPGPVNYDSGMLDRAPESATGSMRVGAHNVAVYSEPSGYSDVQGRLDFGSEVTITEKLKFYKLSARANDKSGSEGGVIPSWVKVEGAGLSGYVPFRTLIDPKLYESQNEVAAKKNAEDIQAKNAKLKKGFSDDEDGDQATMKGFAGVGVDIKKSPTPETQKRLEQYVENINAQRGDDDVSEFRAAGQLSGQAQ